MAFEQEAPNRRASLLYLGALTGMVILGILRALSLFNRSLSIDEPWSANLVHLPVAGMWRIFDQATSQPLYYMLLKAWVLIFGESAAALRVPSLILFVATIVTVSVTARYLFSPFAGLVSAFLVSISDLAMPIAATARMYFLLGFLVALTSLVAFHLMRLRPADSPPASGRTERKQDWGLWAAFVILGTLGLLTHPLFGFFLIACTAAALFISRRTILLFTGGVAASAALYFILWGPHFFAALPLPATAWMSVPGWKDLLDGFLNLWGQSIPVAIAAGLLLIGLFLHGRKVLQFALSRAGKVLLTLVVLCSLVPFALSQWRPVYLATRTPIIFLPAMCVLISGLVDFFKFKWISAVVMLALAVNAAITSYSLFVGPDPAPAQESIAYVIENAQCGDVIIATGLSYSEVTYYFRYLHAPRCLQIRPFPKEIELHPGWLDDATVLKRPGAQTSLEAEAGALREAALQSPGRTWVFYGANRGLTKVLRQDLTAHFPSFQEIEIRGSFFDRILVYSR